MHARFLLDEVGFLVRRGFDFVGRALSEYGVCCSDSSIALSG